MKSVIVMGVLLMSALAANAQKYDLFFGYDFTRFNPNSSAISIQPGSSRAPDTRNSRRSALGSVRYFEWRIRDDGRGRAGHQNKQTRRLSANRRGLLPDTPAGSLLGLRPFEPE